MIGKRFGRLMVLSEGSKPYSGGLMWNCACDCGNKCSVRGMVLRLGKTRSCGCYGRERRIEANKTHGLSGSPTYRSWQHMIERCTDPTDKKFHRYGGRGIKVCDRWLGSFQNFLEDMGIKPSGTTIDRIENNGNYEPSNCRWATKWEQAWNTSQNKKIRYSGEDRCLADWAQRHGLLRSTVLSRLSRGYSMVEALRLGKRPNPCKGKPMLNRIGKGTGKRK